MRTLAPTLALGTVFLLDAVAATQTWPIPVIGILDEPAHLLTAWLVLASVPFLAGRTRRWVLLGAVAIDLDHIPLYAGLDVVASPGGRPVTHSFLTVGGLVALGLVVARWRAAACGLAFGVLLHLARDVVSGPGVPVLWPFDHGALVLPYAVFALASAVAAIAATLRSLSPPDMARCNP